MRIAWLAAADAPDDTASLVAELRARHEVALFDAATAHDVVWMQARQPFDVCVYDADETDASAFVWPYLAHFPGVARVRVRGAARLPASMLASTLLVAADEVLAEALRNEYPGARVRSAPPGVAGVARVAPRPSARVTCGVCGAAAASVATRAARRAHDAGARLELREYASPAEACREAHVLLAIDWPPAAAPPVAALMGMAAGCAVVVYEVECTAGWPALDPQTWEPRSPVPAGPPIVVSIDPRDADHSLMLAMKRLASSPALREELGRAAQAWWRAHATPAHAAAAWEPILAEAAALPAPPRPAGWPPLADGSARAREILGHFGVRVDFLR